MTENDELRERLEKIVALATGREIRVESSERRLAVVEAELAAVRARIDWLVRSHGFVRAWPENATAWRWIAYGGHYGRLGHGLTSDAAIDDAIAKGTP